MKSGRLWCSEGAGVVRDFACAAAFTSTASGRLPHGALTGLFNELNLLTNAAGSRAELGRPGDK